MINLSDFMNDAAEQQEEMKMEEPEPEITFQLNCDQCDFNCTELANLTKHMAAANHFPPSDPLAFLNPNWVEQGPKFECDTCKKEFKSKHGVAIHAAKSHVLGGERKQKVIQGSKGKSKKLKRVPDVAKKTEDIFDPLDALIKRHMQMNQDIVRNIGNPDFIVRIGNQDIVRIGNPDNKARWENTVPVPASLF